MLVVREKDRLGWLTLSRNSTDVAKKPDFRLVLLPLTRQIQGELVDEKGNPLVDFPVGVETLFHKTIGVLHASYGGDELFLPTAKTDATGRFKIMLPATEYIGLRLLHRDRLALRLDVPKDKIDLGRIVVGPAGRIEGQVTDAKTGKPLAMAQIGAQYVGEGALNTGAYGDAKSDKDGRYVIGGLLPGQYNASLWAFNKNSKLVAPGQEGVMVQAGKTLTVNFRASEGRRLAGKVIDVVTGKPLAKFTVGYYGADRPRSGAAHRMDLTDEQGRFEFYVSPGPSYVYVAQGPQMAVPDHHRTVEVMPQRDLTDLVLQATTKTDADFGFSTFTLGSEDTKKREEDQDYRLRIRLRTADGRQVNGATYYIIRGNERHFYGSGSFSGNRYDGDAWGKSAYGIISLFIDANGFNPLITKEFEFSKRMEPLVVDLTPAVYIPVRGRVVDADGKPVVGARVRAGRFILGQVEFPWGVETMSDAEGKFQLKKLRQGERLLLYADKQGVGGVKSARFFLEKDEPFQVSELKIPPGNLSLEGVVTDYDGEVVAGASLLAFDGFPQVEGQTVKNMTKTDANGRFQLQGLLPGKIWLQVEASDTKMLNSQETIAGAKDVRVRVQRIPDPKVKPPTLRVKLQPKDGGKIDGFEWFWIQVGKRFLRSSSLNAEESTLVQELKPGVTYALALAPKGFAWPKAVLAKAENVGEPVVVALDRAAPVALLGRVVDDKGQPMAGVQVGLSRTLFERVVEEPWRYGPDTEFPITDALGRFRFPDLQPGCEVAVYVNKTGHTGVLSPRTTLVSDMDTTLPDIRLLPSERTIIGLVVKGQGDPEAGAKIASNHFLNLKTTTGADGKFKLQHAPHGEIYLTVDAEDYAIVYSAVKADENQIRVTVREEE